MENKSIKQHDFPAMSGKDLTLDWINSDDNALRKPIIVHSPVGLGMKMPPDTFEVNDVTRILGGDTPVEVIGMFQHLRKFLLTSRIRCPFTVQRTGLELGKVEHLLLYKSGASRSNSQCHLA